MSSRSTSAGRQKSGAPAEGIAGRAPELRDLTRTRKQLVREIAQHILRIQKVLEDANVKLTGVVSDVLPTSFVRFIGLLPRRSRGRLPFDWSTGMYYTPARWHIGPGRARCEMWSAGKRIFSTFISLMRKSITFFASADCAGHSMPA